MGLVKPVAAEGSLKDWLEGVVGARGTVHRARQAHYCVGGSAAAGDFVLLDLGEGAQCSLQRAMKHLLRAQICGLLKELMSFRKVRDTCSANLAAFKNV